MSGFDSYDTAADGSPKPRTGEQTPRPAPRAPRPPRDARVADAPVGNWVDDGAPSKLQPYLRLARFDRPIGAWLLLLPGWQSIALAGGSVGWDARLLDTYGWIDVAWLFLAFLIGAFAMRGAGCVLNDIIDRDIDRMVERTRARPLASGAVKLWQAIVLLVLLCLAGAAVLATFNVFSIVLGIAALAPTAVYPFMKRVTFFPQFFLGVAFAWGALLGWAAMIGGLDLAPILLYVGAIFWIMGYDTIYAHQDREDDALIGVKSTALFFGEQTRSALAAFYGLAILFAALAGVFAEIGPWFWLGLGCYAAHLIVQTIRLDIHNPGLCLALFKSNRDAGLLLFGAIVLGSV